MIRAQLLVDASSVLFGPSGSAMGDIVLLLNEEAFPAAGWNDFVVAILEAWISALLRIVRRETEIDRVHFMEGPYAVDVGPLQNGAIRLRALERPDRDHALVDVEFRPLVDSAIIAAGDVLRICSSAHQKSRDIERLDKVLRVLSRELAALETGARE